MKTFCDFCGFYGDMVFVHGHYQCPRCHNNVVPCCEGASEEDAEEEDKEIEQEKEQKKKKEDQKP